MQGQVTTVMQDRHHAGHYDEGHYRKTFTVTLLKVGDTSIGNIFILDRMEVTFDSDANVESHTRTATVYRDAKEAMINALNTWNEIVMTYQDEEPTPQEGEFPW